MLKEGQYLEQEARGKHIKSEKPSVFRDDTQEVARGVWAREYEVKGVQDFRWTTSFK